MVVAVVLQVGSLKVTFKDLFPSANAPIVRVGTPSFALCYIRSHSLFNTETSFLVPSS